MSNVITARKIPIIGNYDELLKVERETWWNLKGDQGIATTILHQDAATQEEYNIKNWRFTLFRQHTNWRKMLRKWRIETSKRNIWFPNGRKLTLTKTIVMWPNLVRCNRPNLSPICCKQIIILTKLGSFILVYFEPGKYKLENWLEMLVPW